MADRDDEFLRKLRETFRIEADEHIEAMSSGLLALERATVDAQRLEIVETIFREAHSLKGAARAVTHAEVEAVCHALENLFAGLKSNRVSTSLLIFDLVHQALDVLAGLLGPDAPAGAREPVLGTLLRQLDLVANGRMPGQEAGTLAVPRQDAPPAASSPSMAESAAPAANPGPGTIRVHTAKLDAVMRQTEELLAPRLAAGQRTTELRATGAALAAWKKKRVATQPALRALERSLAQPGRASVAAKERQDLTRLLEYLDAENRLLQPVEEGLAKLEKAAAHDHRTLSAMVDGLLHDVKEMHMLPFSSLLDALPRLARELARDQGKQVTLAIRGDEIEIDRRILEEMKDPLNHLLRNCIDHGIEKPQVRERKGKPQAGTLTIAVAQQDSGKVEIRIADDGTGVDVEKVKAAAGRLGLLTAEEIGKLDEREALALIFKSGLSTSPMVTDLSGRGLGLAIVREKIERLRGRITLETQPDAGVTFRIILPLTLATFRGVLVRAGEQLFVIPDFSVERVMQVADADVRTVENRETVPLDGQTVALAQLGDVLEMPRARGAAADNPQVVVLAAGMDRIAFRVDEVLAEQEVLVKGLGPQLARVRNIASAGVLGTGQVVPVLNVPDVMKSAMKPAAVHREHVVETASESAKRSILVVEDSITSRALLKNILESAGYDVMTAVDGVDAYTALKTGTFDVVVSDVEMPRMDGFDLTAKVRADKQLSALPVVLVTALGSREHRERGIDVGANAYIVKSSFDQSNLLEVIGRLI